MQVLAESKRDLKKPQNTLAEDVGKKSCSIWKCKNDIKILRSKSTYYPLVTF